MTTDVRGHTVPAANDHPSRAALIALALSVKDPIVVASASARATKVADLAAAGVTASAANPIFFWRQDAGAGLELEATTDGVTFRTLSSVATMVATDPGTQMDFTSATDLAAVSMSMVTGRRYRITGCFEGVMVAASTLVTVRLMIAGGAAPAGYLFYGAAAAGQVVYGNGEYLHTSGSTAAITCAVRVSSASGALRITPGNVRLDVQDVTVG